MPEYFDEVAHVSDEDRDYLWDSARFAHAGRLGGPAVDQPFRHTLLVGGRRGGRTAAAAAAVPALGQLMREAARQEEEFVAYRRRAIALGIDPELADQAYEEAVVASQHRPRPFRIADAEDRLRRLVGPADVPPDFVTRLGRAREHHDSSTMDGVHQQIVEDARRAHARLLERRERDLRDAYAIPEGATTAEAIRIIRQHGDARPRDLHAPGRAVDFAVPWFGPDELHQFEVRTARRLDGESRLDAIDRVLAPDVDDGYRYSTNDQRAFDTRPDHCWRCCAVEAENDLGTCNPCREDLRS